MMDLVKSDEQLGTEVYENVQTLFAGHGRHIKNPVDSSDAYERASKKLHEDAIAELMKIGKGYFGADFIAWLGECQYPEEIIDYYNKKALADYNSVLRTLAKRKSIRLT